MVNSIQRTISVVAVAIVPVLFCQCKTQRTVLGTRSSKVSIAGGEKAGDVAELTKKYAESGYTITEDGSIKADNENMYAGDFARGTDKSFGKKEAKFKNMEARTREFKTPEFIKRQDFRGVRDAQESGAMARESGSTNRDGRKLFQSKTRSTGEMTDFGSKTFEGGNKVFGTSANAAGLAAVENAPVADGVQQSSGYRDNASMTFDDVKKMLNPGSYARNTDLTN